MFLSASYQPAQVEASLSQNLTMAGETSGNCSPEETVSGVRSRRRISELPCCPVCSCTLRPGELHAHLTVELDRLARLTSSPAKRRSGTPSTSVTTVNGMGTSDEVDTSGCTGSEVYEVNFSFLHKNEAFHLIRSSETFQ